MSRLADQYTTKIRKPQEKKVRETSAMIAEKAVVQPEKSEKKSKKKKPKRRFAENDADDSDVDSSDVNYIRGEKEIES